ncbi:hypothetical protein NBO_23g0001 [Nosema bombycis CQ1]|uniref:Uncharacterized protein n=1 Tax=Nosema bombycis (strain CQ1 / CVCC 102059) TaxID=578461 RepID=R0MNZ5_NOSB1|nr:hypothetical protein NBO_23g0001 [Nosema bombycis CQ1]|eukprot:EOB14593.1 hypothetical protein NBO_23g0001 [Nosema bombycis CQ1]
MEKEKTRRFLFKNTSNLLKRLGFVDRELFIDQKLFILEELNQKYTKMVEEREKEVLELLNSIRNKEEILNLNIKDFKEGFRKKDENTSCTSIVNDSFLTMDNVLTTDISRNEDSAIKSEKSFIKEVNGSITNSNMDHLRNYLKELSEEYESRIQEIFINTKTYLEELCKLFTLKIDNYDVSTEGINSMRKTIEDLEPKKELYLEITSLIQKRDELLVSMNEFEKIASDPRRLFKSSFQLLREEKFRKTAFPSLLKIEDELFKILAKYKEKFGEFMKNDKPYELTLKEEIEGRIINKNVFINKFDSPRRKKN